MGLLLQGNCFSYAIQEKGRFVFVSLFSICEYVWMQKGRFKDRKAELLNVEGRGKRALKIVY